MPTPAPEVPSKLPDCLKGGELITLEQGTRVFQAGDSCTQFFYLLEGSVRVDLLAKNGRSILLYRLGAEETCVLTTSCLMSGDDYYAEAHTESDITACVIPLAHFETQLNASADFRKLVFSSYSEKLASMMGKIEEVAFVPIEARLAARLLELGSAASTIQITHEQIAFDLGTAREVVSRKLAQWARAGFIERSRGSLRVVDKAELEKLVALGD